MKITDDDALEHVDKVVANAQGTRGDHMVLQASMTLLRNAVADAKKWRVHDAQQKAEQAKHEQEAARVEDGRLIPANGAEAKA